MRKKMGHSLPEDKSTHISIKIKDYEYIKKYAEWNGYTITFAVSSLLQSLRKADHSFYF